MGKIIAVVGNSGVGKTTFVKALCQAGGFTSALEQHTERPFQALFAQDLLRYALANQVDYLLLRAEQEQSLRAQPRTGVFDGGLDLDYQVFTRLFYRKGYLTDAEFALCTRLYHQLRSAWPPPDLTVWLHATPSTITERFSRRQRPLQIAQIADLQSLQELLEDWLFHHPPPNLVKIDASQATIAYQEEVKSLLSRLPLNLLPADNSAPPALK